MAHELNQPLNAIKLLVSNLSRNLERKSDLSETLPPKLQRISEQVDRAARLIDHLRLYSRRSGMPGDTDQVVFDPRVPVQDAITMFSEQLALESIHLEAELSEFTLGVRGDPLLLEQVVMNLIGNARDAIRDNTVQGEARYIWVRLAQDGHQVRIEVEDTGGGASEQVLAGMFQPFFTTKDPGKGTGLGLSIAYTSIRNMGGQINAENSAQGLKVTISLPLSSPLGAG